MATVVERDVVTGGQPPTAETRPEARQARLPLGPIKTIHVLRGRELCGILTDFLRRGRR